MDSQKQKSLEQWLQDRALQKSRARRKKELPDDGGVTINSLMDAVTIILIFLLMNFSTDSLKVSPREELDLPRSTTTVGPKSRMLALTVTANGILVGDKEVVKIKDNQLQTADPNNMIITPLKNMLDKTVKDQREFNAKIGVNDTKDMVTIIIHGGIQFHLVNKILYTAGQATFKKFKFAVVKGGMLNKKI